MCMNSQGTRRALLPRGPKGDRDPEPKPTPRLAFSQGPRPSCACAAPGGGSWCSWCVFSCAVAMALWLVAATWLWPYGWLLLRTVTLPQIYSGLKVARTYLYWRAAPTIRASVAISVMAGASVAISMVLVLVEQPPPLLVLFLFLLLLAFQRLRDLIVHEKVVQLLIWLWHRQSRCRRLLSRRGGQGFQRNSDESAVGTSRSLRRRTRCRSRRCRSPPTFTRCPFREEVLRYMQRRYCTALAAPAALWTSRLSRSARSAKPGLGRGP